MFGALGEMPLIWKLADVSMGLMAITNLIAILLLSGVAFKLAKDYNQQLSAGKVPTFDINDHPELKKQLNDGIWEKESVKQWVKHQAH